ARPAPAERLASKAANSSKVALTASSARARLSVEGQRGLPSGPARLERLKVVGSRPAARARPEAVSPWRSASASIARQIWACCITPSVDADRGPAYTSHKGISTYYWRIILSELAYKVCSRAEWLAAEAQGAFTGSAVDARDGYIHLSTATQA